MFLSVLINRGFQLVFLSDNTFAKTKLSYRSD